MARRKWCKARGLEEQRLFEMAKLRSQFQGILAEVGLYRRGEGGSAQSGMSGRRWAHGGSSRGGRRCSFALLPIWASSPHAWGYLQARVVRVPSFHKDGSPSLSSTPL